MRISIFGLGYVGCVTAACLAKNGHDVIGVDTNPDKVDMITRGVPPIVEPGLDEVLSETISSGRLRATTVAHDAVAATDLSMICVGTPSQRNGALDLSSLERVVSEIGAAIGHKQEAHSVVVRSTVLPGTTDRLVVPLLRAHLDERNAERVRVAVNPEFMREGSSLRDFATPPFTVVGCEDTATAELLRALYVAIDAPFVHTATRTAEMVKYASNAFHALKVCFANELADACTGLGADVQEVSRIFLLDRKLNVSEAYLRPGFAFGGSCLPKDLRALLHASRTADIPLPLLSVIPASNEGQIRRAVEFVLSTGRRRIGVVGLSFKPGTDDLRESPMVALVETLIGKGCDVRVLDRGVSIARLVGANRRYIEEEIPHIASILCDGVEPLLGHAELLVVGSASPEAREVLDRRRPEQAVVDLTRGAAGGTP